MANEFCTGAVHLFVEPMANNKNLTGINYLGTCETAPDQQTERSYKQLRNDLSSERSFDYVYSGGKEATVSMVLTRWNEVTWRGLERAPVSGLIGSEGIEDIGSLMFQEELAWILHIVFTFGGITAARPSMVGQENGKKYVAALFWGPERDETGTKERKKHAVFRCGRKWNLAAKRFDLYEFISGGSYVID